MTGGFDSAEFRHARCSGLLRLVEAAEAGLGGNEVDARTVTRVMDAAYDLQHDLDARRVDGFDAVASFASLMNGPEWAHCQLVDPGPRWVSYRMLVARAHAWGMRYGRLPRAERESTVNDLALYLNRSELMIPGSAVPVSTWDRWESWRHLLSRRFAGAARAYDKTYGSRRALPHVPLEWFPDEGDVADERPLVDLEATEAFEEVASQMTWELARRTLRGITTVAALGDPRVDPESADAFKELTTKMSHELAQHILHSAQTLASTREGPVRAKATTVRNAAGWLIDAGVNNPSIREFTEAEPEARKLMTWMALRKVEPTTWGRYAAHELPTRDVLREVAGEVDARSCGCTETPAGRHQPCFFHAVEARHRGLHMRLVPAIVNLVETTLKAAAHELLSDTDESPAPPMSRPATRRPTTLRGAPRPEQGAHEPTEPEASPRLVMFREKRLRYPTDLGYDHAMLVESDSTGVMEALVVVHSDAEDYPGLVGALRAEAALPRPEGA